MDNNQKLTDRERVELTQKAYAKLELGQSVTIDDNFIGIVTKSVYAQDGLRAYIIVNPREVTILFKGSYGFIKGNPTTWHDEWLKTNLPILIALLAKQRRIPSQLKTAAKLLNETIRQFKNARFYIYGHSLGSINAQYALANCRHPQNIAAAYLYEGTNIWLLLDQKQRRRVSQMRSKIYNYVDIYDPVTLGITASHHMVGKLCYIDSKEMKKPIKQHMWGGYQFDHQGNLKLRPVDQAFLEESRSERKILTRSNNLVQMVEKMGQSSNIKKFAQTKILDLEHKYPDHKGWEKINNLLNSTLFSKNREEK